MSFSETIKLLLVFFIGSTLLFSQCNSKKGVERLNRNQTQDNKYGLLGLKDKKEFSFKNIKNERIIVSIRKSIDKNKTLFTLSFSNNQRKVRIMKLGRVKYEPHPELLPVEHRKREIERSKDYDWIVLFKDDWLISHLPFDNWNVIKNVDFSFYGNLGYCRYLPIKRPDKFVQKIGIWGYIVKFEATETKVHKINQKEINTYKIITFFGYEKLDYFPFNIITSDKFYVYSTDWWSPELGLVAFDTPTSGVFYLESIDEKTAQKMFR